MDYKKIICELSNNRNTFRELLHGLKRKEYLWKPEHGKWCMLEIICHLYDEEREDFRARVKHVLETPSAPLPPIDPPAWVMQRKYIRQNYSRTLSEFFDERKKSVKWLKLLSSPKWNNCYHHPKFGPMSGKMFLSNWIAHDYLHIRQILKLKYDYLKKLSGETLNYAGDW